MVKEVVIVGAGRQGRNVLEILDFDRARYPVAGFLDDARVGETVLGRPVLDGFSRLHDADYVARHAWFVALGDNPLRQRIGRHLQDAGATIVSSIHPNTALSRSCDIGVGAYVAAFVRIGSGSRVADWALVESSSCVGCDVTLGSGTSFGSSCVLAGGSTVGDLSFIGAGTIVSNGVRIGANCIVGANAVVVRNIPDGVRAQGVPARIVPRPPV